MAGSFENRLLGKQPWFATDKRYGKPGIAGNILIAVTGWITRIRHGGRQQTDGAHRGAQRSIPPGGWPDSDGTSRGSGAVFPDRPCGGSQHGSSDRNPRSCAALPKATVPRCDKRPSKVSHFDIHRAPAKPVSLATRRYYFFGTCSKYVESSCALLCASPRRANLPIANGAYAARIPSSARTSTTTPRPA
jgi:hypothetical protein